MEAATSVDVLFSIIFLVSGTILLYFGAEGLVTGSSTLAFRVGITPLVVGLTVVAFGTSSPELVVSVSAALGKQGEIALGNVIGSNICNIALIIGVAALIRPLHVKPSLIKRDIILMIGITILMIILVIDGEISRIDGGILFSGIIAYNGITIYLARQRKVTAGDSPFEILPRKERNLKLNITFIVGGIAILVVGAGLFLEGAKQLAVFLGASKAVIGLSIVAFGTSLPELATSMVASFKNEGDISIGNAIGSNIFNILLILGIAAFIYPIISTGIDKIDLAVVLFISILILPLAKFGMTIGRAKGLFLVSLYFGYMYYLYTQLP